jgi:hypothetical protein
VPCTATTDSKCTKDDRITAVQIVAISVSILLVLFVGSAATAYFYFGKTRTVQKLGETKGYLELTEKLLGDERDERELMGHAWAIAEADLSFGPVIGVGAYGRVFTATWGFIPVAVKVRLHHYHSVIPCHGSLPTCGVPSRL